LHSLKDKSSVETSEPTLKLVRIRNPERINALKVDLADCTWDEVYVEYLNLAYDAFLLTFTELYNKHCPFKNCQVKEKDKGKPWMTKSLQMACKKKIYYTRNIYE